MPSSVCIYVYQESLGNYSVKENAMYTVKNGVVEIELGDKVISPDTMSNVSIIVISAGLIVLILGSYLLYTNKINKEEAERALSGSGYKLFGITYEEGVKESFSYRLKKKFRS